MRRLERVYRIDIERSPQCGRRVRDIACIEHPEVIRESRTVRGGGSGGQG